MVSLFDVLFPPMLCYCYVMYINWIYFSRTIFFKYKHLINFFLYLYNFHLHFFIICFLCLFIFYSFFYTACYFFYLFLKFLENSINFMSDFLTFSYSSIRCSFIVTSSCSPVQWYALTTCVYILYYFIMYYCIFHCF